MSSTYRVLCVSHNPAIDTGVECHSSQYDDKYALEMLSEASKQHPECDLIIGRYSYPLIQIGIRTAQNKIAWMDKGWIIQLLEDNFSSQLLTLESEVRETS